MRSWTSRCREMHGLLVWLYTQGFFFYLHHKGQGRESYLLTQDKASVPHDTSFILELSASAKENIAPVAYTSWTSFLFSLEKGGCVKGIKADATFGVSLIVPWRLLQLHPLCIQGSRKGKWESLRLLSVTLCVLVAEKKNILQMTFPKWFLLSPHRHWLPQLHGKPGMASIDFQEHLEGGRKGEGCW